MKKIIITALLSVLLVSCNIKPEPINYGTDTCHYCNMTIVDRQHAAQLVTAKGKVYKFDAAECMINSLKDEFNDTEMAHLLVTDLNEPSKLIDAKTASYLVSEKIESPMGANLSAFKDEISANKAKENFTGTLFSWETIQKNIKK